MIRILLLCFLLNFTNSRLVPSDPDPFAISYDDEFFAFTTEGPFLVSVEGTQPPTNKESYCKGWCRNWIPSKRRYIYKSHIACNNDMTFSQKCLNPGMLEMFPDRIAHILSRHNAIRNTVAIGQLKPKYEEAARMPKLRWDDELARLAEMNVKKCEFEVDFCFDKDNFEHFGQNIAIWDTSYGPVNYTLLIDEMLRNWQRNEKYFIKCF